MKGEIHQSKLKLELTATRKPNPIQQRMKKKPENRLQSIVVAVVEQTTDAAEPSRKVIFRVNHRLHFSLFLFYFLDFSFSISLFLDFVISWFLDFSISRFLAWVIRFRHLLLTFNSIEFDMPSPPLPSLWSRLGSLDSQLITLTNRFRLKGRHRLAAINQLGSARPFITADSNHYRCKYAKEPIRLIRSLSWRPSICQPRGKI